MSALSRPEFHSEEAAFAHLEKIVWAGEPVCPHCGSLDRLTKVKANPAKRIRVGLWRCGGCKKQFRATVGTVFEHIRLPLHKALQAVYLMTSSKKGVSAHQIHRTLEITYKSAWFLLHRIREAMRSGSLAPMGGDNGIVEVDETYIGVKKGTVKRSAYHHKMAVVSLVDRATGEARSSVVIRPTRNEIEPILNANLARETRLMTDEARLYVGMGKVFVSHESVRHGFGEYVDAEIPQIHSNTVEGYFSIFKRGMKGIYQHCGEQHLHRYLAEFEFRYNNRIALGCNDTDRATAALRGMVGKRLTYAS
jgi:transposase-like protein